MSPERRARDPGVHTAQPRPGRSVGCCVTILRLDSSALREWERIVAGPVTAGAPTRRRAAWPLRFARLAAQGLLVTLLPFLVLVKVAVFLYTREGCATMLALAGGTACTAAVVTAYAALVWHRVTGRVRLALVARRFALPLVVAYCGYAVIYLSSANAKSERVRAYYASLHPLLRPAGEIGDHEVPVGEDQRRERAPEERVERRVVGTHALRLGIGARKVDHGDR